MATVTRVAGDEEDESIEEGDDDEEGNDDEEGDGDGDVGGR